MSAFLIFSILSGVFQLLLPMFLSIHVYADAREKKGYFSLYMLRIFKVYGGYATLYDEGIAFHLTKNKAVLLPYREFVDTGKSFKLQITRGFYIYAYSGVVEIGSRSEPAVALLAASLLQTAAGIAAAYVFNRNKCASFKNDVVLYEDKDYAKISIRMILVFNFLVVIVAAFKLLLKKIMEKIYDYERKRKKQKSQRASG